MRATTAARSYCSLPRCRRWIRQLYYGTLACCIKQHCQVFATRTRHCAALALREAVTSAAQTRHAQPRRQWPPTVLASLRLQHHSTATATTAGGVHAVLWTPSMLSSRPSRSGSRRCPTPQHAWRPAPLHRAGAAAVRGERAPPQRHRRSQATTYYSSTNTPQVAGRL